MTIPNEILDPIKEFITKKWLILLMVILGIIAVFASIIYFRKNIPSEVIEDLTAFDVIFYVDFPNAPQ